MPTRPVQEDIYIQRVNAVIAHIRENLDDELSLHALAQIAGFSPFHFHRLFSSITGETLNATVTRLRLERAVLLLRSTPTCSITDAAFTSGFQSVAVFSRAFKKHYGCNASQWDRQSLLKHSKNGQVLDGFPRYTLESLSDFAARDTFGVCLRSLPPQRLAYIRVYDSYSSFDRVKAAYHRLLAWYCQRGGNMERTTLYGRSQDDPDVTPLRLCRFDWCVTVPADWQPVGEVCVETVGACQLVTVRCLGDLKQEDKAFQYLFRYWLPRSRYQPANLPALEIYRRQPAELGWETFDIECAVPIVPL
jgi:AraC family transcriptional regulator